MSYRPLVRAPQSDSLSLSLSPSLSLSLSGAVPRERNLVCEGGRLFGEAAGRADEALRLPYTAAPGPGGPGRPATIDSAALQPPVDVQTPSRSSRVERRRMRLAVV